MKKRVKKCPKCQKVKPLDNFNNDKSKLLRVSSYCKKCAYKRIKFWRIKNPKKLKEHASLYNKRHRKTINEKLKIWQKNNRKKTNKYFIKWGKKNPELLEMKKLRQRAKARGVNLSFDKYKELLKNQNNRCAICGKEEITRHPKSKTRFILSIDHCHKTKMVRGLLCKKCNTAIGMLSDDKYLVEKALNYLKMYDK